MIEDRSNPVQAFRTRQHQDRFKKPDGYLKILLLLFLFFAPFLFSSFEVHDVILKIVIFSVMVASYDVILGYTGIISLGHIMFFGIGAYTVAIFMARPGWVTYRHLAMAIFISVILSGSLSVLIGFFSLRIKAIFFAMVTLAFLEFSLVLSSQLRFLTGGEDGISFGLPGVLSTSFNAGQLFGTMLSGRVVSYYLVLLICIMCFLLMLRFVHSPLGRVLQAIRDNEPRSVAIGYRTYLFQVVASTFASCIAAVAGACFAIWVRYVSPDSTLSVSIMLDVLLMVIIGGIGTLYGGILGASFLIVTRSFLPKLQSLMAFLLPDIPLAVRLSERWLLYLGLLFILVVYFFPKGIMGTAKEMILKRKSRSIESDRAPSHG